MIRVFSFLTVLVLAAAVYFALPLIAGGEVLAQPTGPVTTAPELGVPGASGTRQTCASLEKAKGGVLLGRIVPCITHSITVTTESFLTKMIDLMMPIVYAFLTLVITFFGVKVLQGEREIGVQAFLLAVKISVVLGMLQILPSFVEPLYGAMSDGVEITTNALIGTSFEESCSRDINKYGDGNTPKIWMQMDCVIGKLYGFTTGNGPNGTKTPNMVLSSSALGLMTGFFFGGSLGVAVFFALIGALWSIMWMVLKVVVAFINGYLLVCVMLLVAPIFMPLTLMKVTNDFFEKWWRIMLGGMLMPILVAAYSMFALMMYDELLFKDDSRLKILFDKAKIEGALQHGTSKCDFNITNDPGFKESNSSGELDELLKSPFLQNFTQPLLSGGSNICGLFAAPKFKLNDINSQKFKDERKALEGLFKEALELFIMAFLIASGLGTVLKSLNTMTGSSAAIRAFDSTQSDEKMMQGRMRQLQQNASSKFSSDSSSRGVSGSEFLKRFAVNLGKRPEDVGK